MCGVVLLEYYRMVEYSTPYFLPISTTDAELRSRMSRIVFNSTE
jgi:hypothetical protein